MYSHEPRIQFPVKGGSYLPEYIPLKHSLIMDWLRSAYCKARVKLGKDVYYWQVRHIFDLSYRKSDDIAFILHVIRDHDGKPKDKHERRHYKRAWRLYGHEMKYILSELGIDELTNVTPEEYIAHPYIYAYLKHWTALYTDEYTKLTYHGLSWDDYRALLEQQRARAKAQLAAYLSAKESLSTTPKKPHRSSKTKAASKTK